MDAGCPAKPEHDEIVVCGAAADRYRLPLPDERESRPPERARGELLPATEAFVSPGRCGIFAGDRRCSKAEAAQFGYGNGHDPLSVLVKLGTKLLDPDAELGPIPPPPPRGRN